MINLLVVGLSIKIGAHGGITNYVKILLENIDRNKFKLNYFSLGRSPNWYNGKNRLNKYKFWLFHFRIFP